MTNKVESREGLEYRDKIYSTPRYGFLLSPQKDEVLVVEGAGSWIDMYEARRVVACAQGEVNQLRIEKQILTEALEGLLSIVSDSRGVDGYHLNGDVADWDEFCEVHDAENALAVCRKGGKR